MKPEDLGKSVNFLVDSLIEWALAVRHPFQTAIKIATTARNPVQAFRNATRLWFISSLISYIFYIPLYQLHGISWGNVGFHLIIILYYLSFYVTFIFSIYGSFKIFQIKITFSELYVFYTALLFIYFPFINLIRYPITLGYISEIRILKASGKDLTEIPFELLGKMTKWSGSPLFDFYQSLSLFLVALFALGLLTCVVNALSFKFGVSKHKLMDALSFGLCLNFFPSYIFSLFFMFLIYAFLQ